jgi:hypothetical protein
MEEMSVDVLYMEEHYIADMFRSYNVILGSWITANIIAM